MRRAKPAINPPNPSPGFVPCKDCGGLHYGSFKCPYLLPCVICGDDTLMACADCSIDSAGEERPRVCVKPECRDAHESTHGTRTSGPASREKS